MRVTVASDSAYVVDGIMGDIAGCVQRGWRQTDGGPVVANLDLWVELLALVNKHAEQGVEVGFWLIDQEMKRNAVCGTWKARSHGMALDEYTKIEAVDFGLD